MNILIIGNGGREHALAWKAARSPQVEKVWVAPGNAGTALEDKVENLDIAADQVEDLVQAARDKRIDLAIVGPEQPLVAGVVDAFEDAGLRIFGPRKTSARLEGSKAYTKSFLEKYRIPTAGYQTFTQLDPALKHAQSHFTNQQTPLVIKADGLAAGKGVIIARDLEEAGEAIRDMMENERFGVAGRTVVIEEFLNGEEASFICVVSGDQVLPLASSQDHKARDNGDKGPNTGGMGAYSPAPIIDAAMHDKIMNQVMLPTANGLIAEGTPYTGFLYAGLMIDSGGNIKVLEFNCRFGDPETQPIVLRMNSDLVSLCMAALDGKLNEFELNWRPEAALGVVMAAGGYPLDYRKGDEITGLPATDDGTVKVFHAGTRLQDERVLTDGGRVLCVTALGETVLKAQLNAYQVVRQIQWQKAQYRTDIGYRAVAREVQ